MATYVVNNAKSEFNTYTVLNNKACFYNSADEATKRKAYLVKNELIQLAAKKMDLFGLGF